MKHLIKKKGLTAWCKRPGCMVSLQGGCVLSMSKKDIEKLFNTECPRISGFEGKNAIKKIVSRAKKEIKIWNKVITYWNNK